MRILLIAIVFFIFSALLTAQSFELKTSPFSLLSSRLHLAGEFGLSQSFGLELRGNYRPGSLFVNSGDRIGRDNRAELNFRYYFKPVQGNDRMYLGAYSAFRNYVNITDLPSGEVRSTVTRFTSGVLLGQKWVSPRGILIDIAVGFGRRFGTGVNGGNDIPLFSFLSRTEISTRLAVGYRF